MLEKLIADNCSRWDFVRRHETSMVWIFAGLIFLIVFLACFHNIRPLSSDMMGRYAPMAEAFAAGEWHLAFHPRFCVQFSVLTGTLVWLTGMNGMYACQTVALLFWALAVIPLWVLGKRMFGRIATVLVIAVYLSNADMLRYAVQGWRDDCRILPLLMMALGFVKLFCLRGKGWLTSDTMMISLSSLLLITLRVDCFLIATVFVGIFNAVCLYRKRWISVLTVTVFWWAGTMVQCMLVYTFEGWFLPAPQFIPMVTKLLEVVYGV